MTGPDSGYYHDYISKRRKGLDLGLDKVLLLSAEFMFLDGQLGTRVKGYLDLSGIQKSHGQTDGSGLGLVSICLNSWILLARSCGEWRLGEDVQLQLRCVLHTLPTSTCRLL